MSRDVVRVLVITAVLCVCSASSTWVPAYAYDSGGPSWRGIGPDATVQRWEFTTGDASGSPDAGFTNPFDIPTAVWDWGAYPFDISVKGVCSNGPPHFFVDTSYPFYPSSWANEGMNPGSWVGALVFQME